MEDAIKEQIAEEILPEAKLYSLLKALEAQGQDDLAQFYIGELMNLLFKKRQEAMGPPPSPMGPPPGGPMGPPPPQGGGPPGFPPQVMPNAMMGVPPPTPTPQAGPVVPPDSPRPGAQEGVI